MRKLFWLGGFAIFFLTAALTLQGTAQSISAIEHALNLAQRPDGDFDVTCIDGLTEVRTRADILANRVCAHLRTFNGRWTLIEGGIDNGSRFCDMDMNLIRSDSQVLKLRAGFSPPCLAAPADTQSCNGLMCSLQLGSKFFSFDFTTAGQMTLTRLEDGFTAVYRGHAGNGSGSTTTARLETVNGIQNILQSTNDNGLTWRSVCDDSFGQEEATVACREMGASGVQSLSTSVYVGADTAFGWDDLICAGTEMALSECRHTDWGAENCDEGEHVQLICAP